MPDSRPAIQAASTATLDLQMAVHEGLDRRPGQKFEVGGLLLGSVGDSIRIESIQPMPIEHRFGPSFWLSSADVAKWRQTVAQIEAAGPAGIVGHYRSQRTDGTPSQEAAPQDVDHAIAGLLNIPAPLLVLLPLTGTDVSEVQIYRRTDGLWKELLRGPLENLRVLPVTPPRPAAAVPVQTPPQRRKWLAILTSAAAVLILLLALIVWRRSTLHAGAAGPIGLTAHATTGGIALGWNRDSAVVRQSTNGNLTIQDGDNRQQLTLNHDQLLDGSAVYVPKTSQVDFRLEVYRDADHFTGESLSVATGAAPAPAAAPQQASASPSQAPAVSTPQQESAPPPRHASPIRTPQSGPVRGARDTAVRSPAPPAASQPAQVAATAAFHPLTPEKRADPAPPAIAPPPSISAPPTVGANTGEAPRTIAAPLQLPSPPPGRTQPNSVTPIDFKAPVPSRKVNPSISPDTRALLDRMMAFDKLDKLSVDIRVEIDATGAVSGAAPANALNVPQKLLAPSAIHAARLWRFQPALRNSKPVPSDYVVSFVFSRH